MGEFLQDLSYRGALQLIEDVHDLALTTERAFGLGFRVMCCFPGSYARKLAGWHFRIVRRSIIVLFYVTSINAASASLRSCSSAGSFRFPAAISPRNSSSVATGNESIRGACRDCFDCAFCAREAFERIP